MPDLRELDRAFHFVMETLLRTGSAPRDVEIAAALGSPPVEGQRLVRELMDTKVMPMWVHPGTTSIASFAPFGCAPTRYRITVDGHQRWFGQ
jgi:hypothetical protein